MQVVLGKYNGFCSGVRRAVETAEKISGDGVFILGELIHNESVIADIESKGTKILNDVCEVSGGKVIIRSHGVGKDVYAELKRRGAEIVDCTCPFVRRTQKIVERYRADGYKIIIVGEKNHPEVIGINGWCDGAAFVTDGENLSADVFCGEKVCIVAQTTFSDEKFARFLQEFDKKRCKTVEIFDTICYTTKERQKEAEALSRTCDCMIVVGGAKSSNTQKLYGICKKHCSNVFLVTDAAELDKQKTVTFKKVGIVSGASTPLEQSMEVFFSMEKNTEAEVKVTEETAESNVNETTCEATCEANEEVKAEATADAVCDAPKCDEQVEEVKADAAAVAEAAPETEAKKEDKVMSEMDKAVAQMDDKTAKFRKGQKITATISSATDEGLAVYISNTKKEILLPKEEINCESYDKAQYAGRVGEEIQVKITGLNPVQLSEKAIAADLENDKLIAEIADGTKEFSVTTDGFNKGGLIGHYAGYEVFIPSSQIRIGFVKDLDKYVGKTLRLKAEKVENGRRKQVVASQRIILEAERAERDAERAAKEEEFFGAVAAGDIIKGTVVRFASFGAFVDVNGIDCLAHISDLSWTGCATPGDILEIGKEYEFKVLKCDKETKKVSLGYKQLQPRPWDLVPGKYMVGDIVKGKVVRIVPFGAFVELEKGIDGLVHVSQISHEWLENPTSALKVGEEVEAKIIAIDHEKEKITLSIKAMTPAPENASRRPSQNGGKDYSDDKGGKKFRKNDDEDNGEFREWKDKSDGGVSIADLLANSNNTNK